MFTSEMADDKEGINAPSKGTNTRKLLIIAVVVVLVVCGVLALIFGLVLSRGNHGSSKQSKEKDRLLENYTYATAAVASDHQTCSTIGK